MVRFLRRFRADLLFGERTGKYLRYALGELLLVVIGILIALQINNWNQRRIEHHRVHEFAQNLILDLERDLEMMQPIRREMQFITDKVRGLADYLRDRELEDVRNLDLVYFMRDPYYRPYSWNRVTFDQMKSAGVLRQLRNRELANKLAAYDAFTRHLDDDFQFDRSVGGAAFEHALELIDTNYSGIDDVKSLEEMKLAHVPFSFPDTPLHEAFGTLERPLLTDDLRALKSVLGHYQQLVGNYGLRPRLGIEMPKLEADIRELLAMLRAEFPE